MLRRFLASALSVIAIATLAAACAGNNDIDPCKRALERLVDECGYDASGVEGLDTHCTGQSACIANCLDTAPCDDINKNKGEFAACTADCQ